MDVSFISLREILPHVAMISNSGTAIVAMVKPQFEAGNSAKHKGVIKNDKISAAKSCRISNSGAKVGS